MRLLKPTHISAWNCSFAPRPCSGSSARIVKHNVPVCDCLSVCVCQRHVVRTLASLRVIDCTSFAPGCVAQPLSTCQVPGGARAAHVMETMKICSSCMIDWQSASVGFHSCNIRKRRGSELGLAQGRAGGGMWSCGGCSHNTYRLSPARTAIITLLLTGSVQQTEQAAHPWLYCLDRAHCAGAWSQSTPTLMIPIYLYFRSLNSTQGEIRVGSSHQVNSGTSRDQYSVSDFWISLRPSCHIWNVIGIILHISILKKKVLGDKTMSLLLL